MKLTMTGKFIRIFLAAIFITGIISVALCLTGSCRNASSCCHNKMQAAAKNTENCLSHCAKQKVFALKTEVYSQKRLEVKALFNLKFDIFLSLKNFTPKTSGLSKFYLNKAIPILLPSQIYLTPYFTLAPPIV